MVSLIIIIGFALFAWTGLFCTAAVSVNELANIEYKWAERNSVSVPYGMIYLKKGKKTKLIYKYVIACKALTVFGKALYAVILSPYLLPAVLLFKINRYN